MNRQHPDTVQYDNGGKGCWTLSLYWLRGWWSWASGWVINTPRSVQPTTSAGRHQTTKTHLSPQHTGNGQILEQRTKTDLNTVLTMFARIESIGSGHFMWKARVPGILVHTNMGKQSLALDSFENVCMSSFGRQGLARQAVLMWFEERDCLAPIASLGVASSDNTETLLTTFLPTTTTTTTVPINYVQLSATFCNNSPTRRKLFCKLSNQCPSPMKLALKMSPSHIFRRAFCRMIASQYLWKERLDLSWMSFECGQEKLIFFGRQLNHSRSLISANISSK